MSRPRGSERANKMHLANDQSKRREYYGGALMIALGLGAGIQSLSYSRGTLSDMGPGFFPLSLSVLLTLAAAIVLTARSSRGTETLAPVTPLTAESPARRADWRGWSCIALGLAAFIVVGTYGGLVPASFAVVFISALGDRRNSVLNAFILAAISAVVAVVVFYFALQLQMPLFRWSS